MLDAPLNMPPACLVGAGLDGTITHWSAGAQEQYGWTEQEILGRHLSTLACAGAQEASFARATLYSGGSPAPFQARCRTRSGEVFTASVSLTLLRDDRGDVIGTLARHADPLADGRDTELRAGFEDSPVPQSRLDLSGRVLAVNAAMERVLGESAAALLGRDASAMYVPGDRDGLEQALVPMPVPVVPRPASSPPPPLSPGEDERRVLELSGEGASLHTIAAALNAEGRRTAAGPRWTTTTVARVIAALSR